MPASPSVPVSPARRAEPLQRLLFGGIYGTILASALAAALDNDNGSPDPGYDALWVLLTSLASAAAHGYAHAIAHRKADGVPVTSSTVRSVLTEWPLAAAVLPTVAALLGAHAGWWGRNPPSRSPSASTRWRCSAGGSGPHVWRAAAGAGRPAPVAWTC